MASVGFTPYAALQLQGFFTPSYSEAATAGSIQALALAYDQRTAVASRVELGAI